MASRRKSCVVEPGFAWVLLGVARALPLTYAVEAFDVAMTSGSPRIAILNRGVLAVFTALFFGPVNWVLTHRLV